MKTGRMKKVRYSKEFKVMAVKVANHPDVQTQDVAALLNIHPFMLSRWKKEFREGKLPDCVKEEGMQATVKTHLQHIFEKVGVCSSRELISTLFRELSHWPLPGFSEVYSI